MWVFFSGLPLVLWNKETFEAIGNQLDQFLHVEEKTLDGVDKRTGRMLVQFDMSKGLLDKLDIEWRGSFFHQTINYYGIPFRCSKCKVVVNIPYAKLYIISIQFNFTTISYA